MQNSSIWVSDQKKQRVNNLIKVRSIKEETHEDTTERTSDRNGSDPGDDQETDSLEVNGFDGAVAESDSNGRTGDTHGGGDWEGELGEDEDGDGCAHFHARAPGWGMVGDLVAHDCFGVKVKVKV